MQLISKFNKESRFLLCVTNIFSKYAWVIPLNLIANQTKNEQIKTANFITK